jgi:hypothetical protein
MGINLLRIPEFLNETVEEFSPPPVQRNAGLAAV